MKNPHRYSNAHLSMIPDFSLSQDFVYFNDLLNASMYNLPLIYRKQQLYNDAKSNVELAKNELSSAPTIETALAFIGAIADSERKKELKVVKNYCDKIKTKYPDFVNFSEETILADPDAFYKELIKYINNARKQALEYQDQLQRIKANAGKIKGITKKTSRSEYAKDNYLYRLAADTKSLLKKMIGTFEGNNKSADAFTNKLQDMVMEIMKSQNIPQQIKSGDDFAAIAVAILADIEQKLQAEYDKQVKLKGGPELLDELSEETLEQVKQAYIKNIESKDEGTGVQQALKNLNTDDFVRVINNVKNTLHLQQIQDPEKAQAQINKVTKLANNRKIRRRSQDRLVNHIRAPFSRNRKLVNELSTLEFTNLDSNSFHGTIYELLESVINNNSIQIGGSGSAIDVITIEIAPSYKINTNALNGLTEEVGNIISKFAIEDTHDKDALSRDLLNGITHMNNQIDDTMKKIDIYLKSIDSEEPFFIFHESLKLYSSIETGKSASFSGRTLNIFSGLDYIAAAMDSVGINFPGSNGTLRMLALNLSDLAVGGSARGTLEDYLSLFAGLLMFDDVVNIAREAINQIQYDKTNVIHLYLLNGIYVPASTILTYVYNSCIEATTVISAGEAASVTISTGGADTIINNWLETRKPSLKERNFKAWKTVGQATSSEIKMHIAFFAGFIKFISNL